MKIKTTKKYSLSFYTKLFNISSELIHASNPQLETNFIDKNVLINIPGYTYITHVIREEDTFQSLCDTYNIQVKLLQIANSQIDLNTLHHVKKVRIPYRVTKQMITNINSYTYDTMINDIDQLIEVYPFIHKVIIGYSVLNKPIIELRIGNGPYHTHFNGSFHGNEWITSATLMSCINEYALLLTEKTNLIEVFNQTSVSIVPMVNPDGVNLVINGMKSAEHYIDEVFQMNNRQEDFSKWKANIRGVDLNKQFPALWSLEQKRKPSHPTYRDFPGKSPLTEPESIAIESLSNKNNFHRIHAFHTQGEEIYWGFNELEPQLSKKIVRHYAAITKYEAINDIDNYAGYKDWFIKRFRRPGFTIELGKGINPLPIEQFPKIYDASLNIFLANLMLII